MGKDGRYIFGFNSDPKERARFMERAWFSRDHPLLKFNRPQSVMTYAQFKERMCVADYGMSLEEFRHMQATYWVAK